MVTGIANIARFSLAQSPFWQRWVDLFTTPSLTLFLLLGSTILAISLIILVVTRWGHARPITKCVILSVIAHILLLGYCYGTRLILELPGTSGPGSVNVHLIGHEIEGIESEVEPLPGNPTFDQFVESLLQTETESLQRPEPELPFELERIPDSENSGSGETRSPFARIQDVPQLATDSPWTSAEQPNVQLNDTDEVGELTVAPEKIEFQRRGSGQNDVRDHQPSLADDHTPLKPSAELSEVEIKPTVLNQDSFPSDRERVEQFESELVLPDSPHSLVDSLAAATGIDPQPMEEADMELKQPEAAQLMQQVRQARRLADGKPMPAVFQFRSVANRRALAQLRGGSEETENAVDASLKWLSSIQKDDGSWNPRETAAGREDKVYGHDRGGCGANAEMGITALATLAFLGAGHTHLEGEYQDSVQRALEFLIRHQAIDGDLSGGAKIFAQMYCHSMSLLALSEALAMTGDHRLVPSVQSGVGYTVQAQNKSDGGWRYQPGDAGDMSQFGWNVMALHAAGLGGIRVEPATLSRMEKFLASCRTGVHGGLASYRPREGPSTTMTAEAMLCNYFLGMPISIQAADEAKARIVAELPTTARINLYYWYYATMALSQSPDDAWQQWNASLQRVLLSRQIASGQYSGSWSPDGLWAGYGGRVYSTAMATLCLEVYYRYLPDVDAHSNRAENLGIRTFEPIAR